MSISEKRHIGRRSLTIEQLWEESGFTPNRAQREAILHIDGPLYLPAGPGSGKTRVLLWRALKLLVFHDVKPEEIYLSTFTEKAASQLKEGLQARLGIVTNLTGRPFDLAQMYVGTVHSLCQRLLSDRRFSTDRLRPRAPRLLDELGQYFFLYRNRTWRALLASVDLDPDDEGALVVNRIFGGRYDNKHYAVQNCIRFFNRLSEECVDPQRALEALGSHSTELVSYLEEQGFATGDLELLIRLYIIYRELLQTQMSVSQTDFSLIQQEAYESICDFDGAGSIFRHVIVDEYQDTNTIQERLFFKLAEGHGNLCVVGDDDQALYRFRGATVENFVEFPQRCQEYLGEAPDKVPLTINYRSREPIVDYYTQFINSCDWTRQDGPGQYRVADKTIRAYRQTEDYSVLATSPAKPDICFQEIADLVVQLLQSGRVEDPNEIAFLYPSLKSVQVGRAMTALEERGLKVYAPRAGRFLEVDEATEMFGLMAKIFGNTGLHRYKLNGHGNWNEYRTWLHFAKVRADEIIETDEHLATYVADRQAEIASALSAYEILLEVVERNDWQLEQSFNLATMRRPLAEAQGLPEAAQRNLVSRRLEWTLERHREQGREDSLRYIVRRATSLDWSVLDAFYHLCGMRHFCQGFDLAEDGEDEGPICNLALISQYLRRFMDEYGAILTARVLSDHIFSRIFFGSYLYALWRLGESEYEDEENAFPKGRIPFLTIHQSKGLEFPVVVLGNPYKRNYGAQTVERMVRPFLEREPGEPLDRLGEFDIMRMFYVALSRAENLLLIPHFRGQGQAMCSSFRELFSGIPEIGELAIETVPSTSEDEDDLPRSYSYTADYLAHRRCPRQYMIYRKYGFEPSRTQTAFFGSLVHRTLDDLHNLLIAQKQGDA